MGERSNGNGILPVKYLRTGLYNGSVRPRTVFTSGFLGSALTQLTMTERKINNLTAFKSNLMI